MTIQAIYEIPSKRLESFSQVTYEAHGVKKGERIQFTHKGNILFGIIVGCGPNTLLIQVDALSY